MARFNIVNVGLLLAGVLFLFAAIKPTFGGGSINVVFLIAGAVCFVISAVSIRKPSGPSGSAGA